MNEWEVGTDIGGTFTDIVAIHAATGERRVAKVLSRPAAPVDAMLEAVAAIGLTTGDLRRFVHGTTRVTNAIVEGRLPPIALVATAGFEDVLEIGRYRRTDGCEEHKQGDEPSHPMDRSSPPKLESSAGSPFSRGRAESTIPGEKPRASLSVQNPR